MTKILISPLGTGQLDKNNQSERVYRKARYKIGEKDYKTSFIASALKQHFNLDGIVFIGTVKSMWEEVYKTFQNPLDEKYYNTLCESIQNADHNTSVENFNLTPLEKALGNNYKCILIKYGLNEEELEYNLEKILKQIREYFKSIKTEKLEIYLDITHSFRSLSLFIFLIVMLIPNLTFGKKTEIKGVYYGMLDIVSELQYAQIVNLNTLVKTLEFIQASYEFDNFGNGFLLAQLLKNTNPDMAEKIEKFSKAMSMNYSQKIIESLKEIKNLNIRRPYSFFRPNQILEISEKLEKFKDRHIQELELAEWHFRNKNYSNSYILLAEAIVTYQCKVLGKHPSSPENRNIAKDELQNQNSELSQISKEISEIRNNIAHNIPRGNLEKDFQELGNYIEKIKKFLK